MSQNPEVEAILDDLGVQVGSDERVELFHATTKESAVAIAQSGSMRGSGEGIFFGTSRSIVGRIGNVVDGVIRVRVPVEDLIIHRTPDDLEEILSEAERQAEFIVDTGDSATYPVITVGPFEPIDRSAFD